MYSIHIPVQLPLMISSSMYTMTVVMVALLVRVRGILNYIYNTWKSKHLTIEGWIDIKFFIGCSWIDCLNNIDVIKHILDCKLEIVSTVNCLDFLIPENELYIILSISGCIVS